MRDVMEGAGAGVAGGRARARSARVVTALAWDPKGARLIVGYAYAGVDVFDTRANAWSHLGKTEGLLSNRVEGIALVGEDVWVAAREGVTVLTARGLRHHDIA